MRLSVYKDDLGFSKEAYTHKAFCDGVELKHCFTADEEKGVAYVHDIDSFVPGMKVIPKKVIYGKIEIRKVKEE